MNEWIKCSERLPKVRQPVICHHKILGVTVGRWDNAYGFLSWNICDEIKYNWDTSAEGTGESSVTHWMPLPEAPKDAK